MLPEKFYQVVAKIRALILIFIPVCNYVMKSYPVIFFSSYLFFFFFSFFFGRAGFGDGEAA